MNNITAVGSMCFNRAAPLYIANVEYYNGPLFAIYYLQIE
jgi:hypothetical protein